jgi:acetyl-CoA acetyltransferase
VSTTKAVITGIGRSDVGRSLFRDPVTLAVDACLAALADAGLDRSDIDGLAAHVPDIGSAGVTDVQEALRLELNWYLGTTGNEVPGQGEAMWSSCMAVTSGRATHVLAFHSSCEGTIRHQGRKSALPGTGRDMPARSAGPWASWLPYGAVSPANVIAMYAQQHFERYGTTREQLAQIPIVQRQNAGLNPAAVYREPLSLSQYMSARMISDPLCLYDCDIPVDFGIAVVISREDAARDLRKPPIAVEAVGSARKALSPSWTQTDDLTTMLALDDAGAALWKKTDLRPADVDVAGLYDGFSFIALCWLEALGFCAKGDGGAFVADGKRIALDGELPVNTHGGHLSAGRAHGWGVVPEVCTQLWEEGGARQIPNHPRVGVVGCGGGIQGAAALLVRG